MKDFLQSPKIKATLFIVGALIVILIVFGLGIAIGYRKAIFASREGQNYYSNFYGGPPGRGFVGDANDMMRPPQNMHGVAGEVLDVATSTLSVKDATGNEQSVTVASDTAIREVNTMIPLEDIKIGEWVTVIGGPNASGQIEARFIRVFTSSSSLPVPPASQ